MKKVLHIWGINKNNCGDLILGSATKYWFKNNVDNKVEFINQSCRSNFTSKTISRINKTFDYLLLGGGGLILPDTNPNNISCWQWSISESNLKKIKIPIHVVAIGYNLFVGQNINMPNREDDTEELGRLAIFDKNISTLVEHSEYFSLRHNGDINLLKNHIPKNLHNKLKLQFCPTIEYAKYLLKKQNFTRIKTNVWAIETKQDRMQRRYINTTESDFYEALYQFIKYTQQNKPEIIFKILLHEPNNTNFADFLKQKNIYLDIIKNYNIPNSKIVKNFNSIDRLYCMAGHSQMIGHACGCDVRSIITHNKLKFFLEDIDEYKNNLHIEPNLENTFDKLITTIES